MPTFQYRARNQKGELVTGTVDAASAQTLADQLHGMGVIPVSIRQHAEKASLLAQLQAVLGSSGVTTLDLVFFSRQMYTMMKAGIPIMHALDSLLQTRSNPALFSVLKKVRDSLAAGMELSAALRAHPQVFSHLYISMVQMGESTGNLSESFNSMAAFLQTEKEIKDRVKGAMRYPLTVIVAIVIALFILNLKVIPAFAGIFARLGSDLPLMTKVLIYSSEFFKSYWLFMIVAIVAGVFSFRAFVRTPHGNLAWDRAKLTLPIVGDIMRLATLARFARALSVTGQSGVPIVQALPLVGGAVGNRYVEEQIRAMQKHIEQGMSIARAAEGTGLFPPLVLQMIRIGEDTGALDQLITEVADFYEREVDYKVKNISALIEPIMIFIVGMIVLVLALGIFLPMWGLMDAARKH